MKSSTKLAIGALGVLWLVVGSIVTVALNKPKGEVAASASIFDSDAQKIKELEARLKRYEGDESDDQRLGQYVINMMYQSKRTVETLSQARMQMLAKNIVRVANDILDDENQKKGAITALQIESGFLKFAQSPTGPKGLGQLTRATFHESLAACGIPSAKDDDVWETDLNLYAAFCNFKKLLIIYKNDPYQAIVAYNQGSNSADAKSYSRSGELNGLEPLKYVAKFIYLQSKVTDQKTPGVPAIQDMPKPDKHNVPKAVEAMKAKDKTVVLESKQHGTPIVDSSIADFKQKEPETKADPLTTVQN